MPNVPVLSPQVLVATFPRTKNVFPYFFEGERPLTTATLKAISGHVYNASNAPVVGATVVLYRQGDDLRVATTTSGAAGVYSFPRRSDDTAIYYTVAYSLVNGSVQIHGVSNRGLVPA